MLGSVHVAGSVTGMARDGIRLLAGGSVDQTGGSVTGGTNGIYMSGTPGTVTVAASVTGTARFGIDLETGGSVDQLAGSVMGGQEGIHIGGNGTVTQEALATQPASSITGGQDGIFVGGLGSARVAGNVTGTARYGITVGTGTVSQLGGSVSGGQDGIFVGGDGTVIQLAVTGQPAGSIMGKQDGIHIIGRGMVGVAGSVTGTNGHGIDLQADGNVSQTGGSVSGGMDGIYIGGAGSVTQQAGTSQPAGSIMGKQDGIFVGSNGMVSVAGSVTGTNGHGIDVQADGVVSQSAGSVMGGIDGISIGGDGTVTQLAATGQPAASITGGQDGIFVGGIGTVGVAGSVAGTSGHGIDVLADGMVSQSAGSVTGGQDGIHVGGAGTVGVAGSVAGTSGHGINVQADGMVSQSAGSVMGGQDGIFVGGIGTVGVAGSVAGTSGHGINVQADGLVSQTAGSVMGGKDGVHVGGAGTVMQLAAMGQPAASITGGQDGIFVGGIGTVGVAGSVAGTSGHGINVQADGLVSQTAGSVMGGKDGVHVGGAGTVMQLAAMGQPAASITGGQDGIFVGGIGTVGVAGSVAGTSGHGIDVLADGMVSQSAGSVTGAVDGIFVGGKGVVGVAGSVSGANGDGINVRADGMVSQSAGSVMGNVEGIFVGGTGTVMQQAGSAEGGVDGVYIRGAGTVTQLASAGQPAGSIKGGINGIFVQGTGTVITDGSVEGTARYGILVRATGNVAQKAGFVSGGIDGIRVGSTGTVDVAASVSGASGHGINIQADGIVSQSAGSVSGGLDGVHVGGAGTVMQLAAAAQPAGSISGGHDGLFVGGTGTVFSAGTISGTNASVEFAGTGTNRLTLTAGSKLTGDALGSTAATANQLILETQGQADNNFRKFNSLDANGSQWTLNGAAIDVATAHVNSGLLIVGDASHANANLDASGGGVTVASTATLAGAGKVTGAVFVNGIIAPSAGAGVGNTRSLTVAGAMNFASGSVFALNVASTGGVDRLNVSSASLSGGTVTVTTNGTQAEFAVALAQPVDILHSTTGLNTRFAGLSSPNTMVFLTPKLTYDPNNVFLSVALNFVTPAMTLTSNERAVATALDQGPAANPLIAAALGLSPEEAPHAFDALSGEIYASLHNTQAESALMTRDLILDRLRQAAYYAAPGELSALGLGGPALAHNAGEGVASNAETAESGPARQAGNGGNGRAAYAADIAPPPVKALVQPGPRAPKYTFWGQGFGGWGHVDSDGNAAAVTDNFAGFVGGVDEGLANFWRAGFAAGYTHANLDVAARASSANVDSGVVGLYAGGPIAGRFNLRAGATLSFDNADVTRTVSFTGLFDKTRANLNGNVGQVFAELGYGMAFSRIAVEPLAGLAYVHVHTGSFFEDGGLAALIGARGDEDLGYTTLGLRAATVLPLANGMALTPHVSAQWQYAFGDVTPTLGLAFQATAAPFTIAGVPIARNAGLIDAGLDWRVTPQAKLGVSYWGDLASDAQVHAVKGSFTWDW